MKKITLTIGIPVHNEAANIAYLLDSILKQVHENYILEKIIIMCDGTTDKTDKIAKEIAKEDKRIFVVNDKKRKGKLQRLLQMYAINKSDLIAIFDGDVALGSKFVLDNLVNKYTKNNSAIIGANNQPLPTKEFVGKVITTWSDLWYLARKSENQGDNAHNIRGCCMVLEKNFAKSISFPKGLISESQYIYFLAKQQKMKFIFVEDAVVYYRKPTTIADYFLQFRRAAPTEIKLENIFGNWITKHYHISKVNKGKAVLYKLSHDPLFTILSGIFTYTVKFIPYKKYNATKEGVWKRVDSTKKAINMIPF